MGTKFKEPEYITKFKKKLVTLTVISRVRKSFLKHSMEFDKKHAIKLQSLLLETKKEITLIQTILMQFNQMKKMYHRGRK